MIDNRGMSPAQARALAQDPKTSPGVLARLANGYPDVWADLLNNPSLSVELRTWIEKSMADQQAQALQSQATTSIPQPTAKANKPTQAPRTRKTKSRGRRRYGRFIRTMGQLIVPALAIYGLWYGVGFLEDRRPLIGVVAMETLDKATDSPAWKYDLASKENSDCIQYEIGTVDQGQVVVLTQNDIANKDCKDRKDISSTLALVNLADGKAIWEVNLAKELDWTDKWRKQLVEVPGLKEILIKFTDVNGSDAGGNTKSIDKNDDRKMKTIVPFNRLNGRITDPVIAKSNSQPIMQAPVLQVLAIPGDVRSVLVMTNGAKKDFRFAKYRSKRFSSPKWSVESDLRPVGGTQIIGNKLILGRLKDDVPTGINLKTGKFVQWSGHSASKLYYIGKQVVEILGDGVSDKATNLSSQGGPKGKKITINGLASDGSQIWSIEAKGYAISRNDSYTKSISRAHFHKLFILDGKNNQFVSLIDQNTGASVWRTKISKQRFEIGRATAGDRVAVYLFKKYKLTTKSMSLLNLVDGSESAPIAIAGNAVRVDGATKAFSILVDEPDRAQIIKDAENGKVASLDRKDRSDKTRKCVQGLDNPSSTLAWSFECNGNQHAMRAGGRWLILDLTPGSENFWPLKASN